MSKEVRVISFRDGEDCVVVEVEYDFGARDTVTVPYGSSEDEVRRIMAKSYREAYDRFTKRKNVLSILKSGVIVLRDEDFAEPTIEEGVGEAVAGTAAKVKTAAEAVAEKGKELIERAKKLIAEEEEEVDEDSKEGIPWRIPVDKLREALEGNAVLDLELLRKLEFPWKATKDEEVKEEKSGGGG